MRVGYAVQDERNRQKRRFGCNFHCRKSIFDFFAHSNALMSMWKNVELKQVLNMPFLSDKPCPADGCGSYERRPRGNCAECHRKTARRRRERERAAEGSHTKAEWLAKAAKFDFCPLCSRPWDQVERSKRQRLPFTKGHIIALTNFGTNYITNIQPECARCNYSNRGTRRSLALEHVSVIAIQDSLGA